MHICVYIDMSIKIYIYIYICTYTSAYVYVYTYPLAFAPMELSYDSENQLMKFQCTFAFRTWDSEYGNPNPVTGINKGRRAIDALLGIANLRKGGNSANNTLQRFNDRLARFGGLFG